MKETGSSETSTLMMKHAVSSENSARFYQTTRCQHSEIPQSSQVPQQESQLSQDGGYEGGMGRSTTGYCKVVFQRAALWQIPLLLFCTKQSL